MELWMKILFVYLIIANVVAFMLMGVDKSKARNRKRRIRERTLFLSAIVGGSIGAICGMQVFRHKTKHFSFNFGMPLILIIQVVIALVIMF
ncbi:MAG: DUF1294 domain-containing protein [Lachnospiraceae bacterium]|nr:DUF1294 domain-containing protein [Lachnospiraceae bacterium]